MKRGILYCPSLLLSTVVLAAIASAQGPAPTAPPEGDAPPVPAAPAEPAPIPEGAEPVREKFPNGQLAVERYVVRGDSGDYVNHGPWMAYYPDGKKVGGGQYDHGKRVGVWTRWFGPGEGELFSQPYYRAYKAPLFSEASYAGGNLEGPWIIYDADKNVISKWHFHDGKSHGTWQWWYPSGQKRRECTYNAGRFDGPVMEWAPDGKLISQEVYVDGQRKVQQAGYHGPQVKSWEGWYLEPREVTRTSYDWWQGDASTEVVGVEGKRLRHGKWVWWFPDGQKQSMGQYLAGAPDGPWVWWYPNGQKWIEGQYAAGEKVGKWTHWNEDGAVKKHEEFPGAVPPPNQSAPPPDQAAPPPENIEAVPTPTVEE